MAFKFLNRTKETTATTGTGNISLGGAVSGFQAFSAGMANGDTTPYAIEDGANWEEGILTWNTGNTASRSVSKSSNANNPISLSGSATVFATVRSEDVIVRGKFVSTDQTATANSLITVAHGLGARPGIVLIELVCATAEGGWSVGDVVSVVNAGSGAPSGNCAVYSDATNIYARMGNWLDGLLNKTTGVVFTPTWGNWNVRFTAIAFV